MMSESSTSELEVCSIQYLKIHVQKIMVLAKEKREFEFIFVLIYLYNN